MDLIKLEFEKLEVVLTSDNWVNATHIAKQFNKDVREFTRSKNYKVYADALAKDLNTDVGKLHIAKKGGKLSKNEQGTFLHPDLVVLFCRWLSPDFAIKMDRYFKSQLIKRIAHLERVKDCRKVEI